MDDLEKDAIVAAEGEGKPAGLGEDQVTPEPEGDEFEAEGKKRGYKNLILENRRKSEDLTAMKKKVEEAEARFEAAKPAPKDDKTLLDRAPKEVQGFAKRLKDLGYDDDAIQAQIELTAYMANDIATTKMRPHEKVFYKPQLDTIITGLGEDDNYKFAVSKLEKDLRDAMSNYAPEYWGDKELVKTVLGKLCIEKGLLSASQERKIVAASPDIETGRDAGNGASPDKVDESLLSDFAAKQGIDITTPELKQKAVAAFKAATKYDEKTGN